MQSAMQKCQLRYQNVICDAKTSSACPHSTPTMFPHCLHSIPTMSLQCSPRQCRPHIVPTAFPQCSHNALPPTMSPHRPHSVPAINNNVFPKPILHQRKREPVGSQEGACWHQKEPEGGREGRKEGGREGRRRCRVGRASLPMTARVSRRSVCSLPIRSDFRFTS